MVMLGQMLPHSNTNTLSILFHCQSKQSFGRLVIRILGHPRWYKIWLSYLCLSPPYALPYLEPQQLPPAVPKQHLDLQQQQRQDWLTIEDLTEAEDGVSSCSRRRPGESGAELKSVRRVGGTVCLFTGSGESASNAARRRCWCGVMGCRGSTLGMMTMSGSGVALWRPRPSCSVSTVAPCCGEGPLTPMTLPPPPPPLPLLGIETLRGGGGGGWTGCGVILCLKTAAGIFFLTHINLAFSLRLLLLLLWPRRCLLLCPLINSNQLGRIFFILFFSYF